MDTRMKSTVLAKKLRARIVELKRERSAAILKFNRDFETWKKDVAKWLKTQAPEIVLQMTKSQLNKSDYRWGASLPNYIFENMPKAPKEPKDDQIRAVQKALRYIAITAQPTITVNERKLEEWFGKEEDDD